MKNFFNKIWNNIKRGFLMFLISTWYVWLAVIIAAIVGLVFSWNISIWVFFGLVLVVILYIWCRQAYWWFSGKEDYINKGFPKLWRKIFKKNEN